MGRNFHISLEPVTESHAKVGTITTTFQKLKEMFGEPRPVQDRKVSGLWVFKDEEGNTFTIYDWKATCECGDSSLPTKEDFRASITPFEFSLGGKGDSSPSKSGWKKKKWGVLKIPLEP